MAPRKQFLLRLDPALYAELEAWAAGELRSVNGQMEYLLRQAGLVNSRKQGRWIHYRLPGNEAPARVKQAIDWVHGSLADDPRIREDAKTLKAVLKCDPADLCKKQCRT